MLCNYYKLITLRIQVKGTVALPLNLFRLKVVHIKRCLFSVESKIAPIALVCVAFLLEYSISASFVEIKGNHSLDIINAYQLLNFKMLPSVVDVLLFLGHLKIIANDFLEVKGVFSLR